jgi:hypothetical protein
VKTSALWRAAVCWEIDVVLILLENIPFKKSEIESALLRGVSQKVLLPDGSTKTDYL